MLRKIVFVNAVLSTQLAYTALSLRCLAYSIIYFTLFCSCCETEGGVPIDARCEEHLLATHYCKFLCHFHDLNQKKSYVFILFPGI